MSKGKGRGAFMPRGSGPAGGGMMQQLQKLQDDMVKAQEALGDETVEVSVGGGALTVVMDGHQEMRSITIKPEVVDPEDVEMLQDLVLAAVNEAIEKSQALAAERMGSLTSGLKLPGLV